jgi:hypothetical protein
MRDSNKSIGISSSKIACPTRYEENPYSVIGPMDLAGKMCQIDVRLWLFEPHMFTKKLDAHAMAGLGVFWPGVGPP